MAAEQRQFTAREIEAANEYLDRRDREKHPEGRFDKQRRWLPAKGEVCECCHGIRNPSAKWPFSYLLHCRTMGHVANLKGVELSRLRGAVKTLDAQERAGTLEEQG